MSAAALLAAASGALLVPSAGPVLLDGRCDDRGYAKAQSLDIGHGVRLRIAASPAFLYICLAPPPDSLATADLTIAMDGRPPINLHASAQLGEWPVGAEGPGAAGWWNNRGWSANTVRFGGFIGEGADRRARFLPSQGREFQLDRRVFAGRNGQFTIEMHAIAEPGGGERSIRYPRDADVNAMSGLRAFRLTN